MPGGRLTYSERKRIAEGLASGKGYAEIGRSLGRPTSTISREVERNSTADGYRPATAQRANRRRARRPQRTGAPTPAAVNDSYGRDPDSVRDFEERFATLMIASGLPAMVARLLTCLFTHDSNTITAAELASRLRVSPASISTTTRYLEQQGLLRHAPQGRRRLYIIDDDIWYQAWANSARAIRAWADIAQLGGDVLGTDTPAGARLGDTSLFYQLLAEDMMQAAERNRAKVIATAPSRRRSHR